MHFTPVKKVPFVCCFDTESVLIPNNDVKNSTHRHDIVSYKYVIVHKDSNIAASKLETGGKNLGRRMIHNITANSKKKLRRDLEKKLESCAFFNIERPGKI